MFPSKKHKTAKKCFHPNSEIKGASNETQAQRGVESEVIQINVLRRIFRMPHLNVTFIIITTRLSVDIFKSCFVLCCHGFSFLKVA